MKRKLTKEENKILKSLFTESFAAFLVFGVIFVVLLGALFFAILSAMQNDIQSVEELPAGFLIGVVLLWPIMNAIMGFSATHLALKKRIDKGIFALPKNIRFSQFRKKVFWRWYWQTILFQLLVAVILVALEGFGLELGKVSGVIIHTSIMAGTVQMVCTYLYKKGYFTIPAVADSR